MLSQFFHVRDEVMGGVGVKIHRWVIGERSASPTHPLVEQHDAITVWVKRATVASGASRSGASVDHERRLASRVPAGLPIDEVPVPNIEHASLVGLDVWVPFDHEWMLVTLSRLENRYFGVKEVEQVAPPLAMLTATCTVKPEPAPLT